jgi:hypothetical protein
MSDLASGALAGAGEGIVRKPCDHCGRPLTGKQERFCSRLCSSRWYDQQFPRINRGPDGPREGTLHHAILGFLVANPGQWFTVHEIAEAVRAFPHSVSARLSELRRRGQPIESDARNGNSRRAHRFRLAIKENGS